MVEFSYIIVTYLSHQLIEEALQSISQYEESSSYEIIIVDNSPIEGHSLLKEKILQIGYENRVKIIHNPANNGYGGGNNIGIKQAQGQYIIVMNPDVRLMEPLQQDAKARFINSLSLAMIGYQQMGGENISFYRKPEWTFFLSGWIMKLRNKQGKFDSKKDFLSGAFIFLDKEKFEKIGLFDEQIFMYNEESDISNRFINSNFDIAYIPTKKYSHLLDERPFNRNAFKNEMISLKYYLSKHNFDEQRIIRLYLKELNFKKIIAKVLNKKQSIKRFSEMMNEMKSIFVISNK